MTQTIKTAASELGDIIDHSGYWDEDFEKYLTTWLSEVIGSEERVKMVGKKDEYEEFEGYAPDIDCRNDFKSELRQKLGLEGK